MHLKRGLQKRPVCVKRDVVYMCSNQMKYLHICTCVYVLLWMEQQEPLVVVKRATYCCQKSPTTSGSFAKETYVFREPTNGCHRCGAAAAVHTHIQIQHMPTRTNVQIHTYMHLCLRVAPAVAAGVAAGVAEAVAAARAVYVTYFSCVNITKGTLWRIHVFM